MSDNNTDRRLDAMRARSDAIQVCERLDHADRSMPAHSEVSDAVEKNHAGHARIIDRLTQQRSDNSVGAARFVDNRATKIVVFVSKAFDPVRERVIAEVRTTADHDARGLAPGVRIDNFYSSQCRHAFMIDL